MEDFREILIKNNWFNEQELEELFKDGSILNCINECTSPNKKEKIFSAFIGLKPQDVKVLIIGQDPYPDEDRADGLAFSFGNNESAKDSLKNIFDRLKEFGIDNKNTKLTNWRTNGVLLLNSALTFCKVKEKNRQEKLKEIHLRAWTPFVKKVIEKLVYTRENKPLVIMLFGKNANLLEMFDDDSKDKVLLKNNICIIRTSHPSNLGGAKNYCGNYAKLQNNVKAFMCECNNPFKKCNDFFEQKGLPVINWSTD